MPRARGSVGKRGSDGHGETPSERLGPDARAVGGPAGDLLNDRPKIGGRRDRNGERDREDSVQGQPGRGEEGEAREDSTEFLPFGQDREAYAGGGRDERENRGLLVVGE